MFLIFCQPAENFQIFRRTCTQLPSLSFLIFPGHCLLCIPVSALLIVIGSALWGDNSTFAQGRPYAMTCDITAAAMAVIAGVFLALDLVKGGGGGKTTPA